MSTLGLSNIGTLVLRIGTLGLGSFGTRGLGPLHALGLGLLGTPGLGGSCAFCSPPMRELLAAFVFFKTMFEFFLRAFVLCSPAFVPFIACLCFRHYIACLSSLFLAAF